MLSTYFGTKFLINTDKKERTHKPVYAFFYGITFTFCALIRLTNALPLCCIVFVILLSLCLQKKWKNILQNAGMFILGAVALALPFIFYFIRIGAFKEMIYATFIHNFKYVVNNSDTLIHAEAYRLIRYSSYYIFCIFIAILRFILDNKHRELSLCVCLMGCTGLYFQLTNRPFPHYILIFMPAIVLSLCLYKSKPMFRMPVCIITYLSIGLLLSYNLISDYVIVNHNMSLCGKENYLTFKQDSIDISNHIPNAEKSNVIAYNIDTYFYCVTDILPCYKFFMLQEWLSNQDNETKHEIRHTFESLEAKYIVTMTGSENGIDDLLENHYHLKYENSQLTLWERNLP